MKFIMFFLIMSISPSIYADIYLSETRIFNLVTGEARLVPGIEVSGDAAGFIVQDANQPWTTTKNGKTYQVTTLKYSYQGTVSLKIDSGFYTAVGCDFLPGGQQLYVGWTVMQPGVSGVIYNSAGALYYQGFGGGVGAQTRWRGVDGGKPTFTATFTDPGVFAYVYVSDAPAGFYTMPGGKSVYVHTAGQKPNAVPYADIYGLTCGAVLGAGTTMETDPIIPVDPDVYCEFDINDDINLGVVDAGSAQGTTASTLLTTTCNADTTVTAILRAADGGDNVIEMGGLTIPVTFDNNSNKINYQANNGQNQITITARITSVVAPEPNEYKKSMVIYLNYQ